MAKVQAFDDHARAYDEWYERHVAWYHSELAAVRGLLPDAGKGVEIGPGSGRFAGPLGVEVGVEPSRAMRALAQERGINVLAGVAEQLPLEPEIFDYALLVTALCFLDSPQAAFREVFRILKPGASVVIGFIDRESALGRSYQQRKGVSSFYRGARFHTAAEVKRLLEMTGFMEMVFVQTLFPEFADNGNIQPIRAGYGEGAFVVVRGNKPEWE